MTPLTLVSRFFDFFCCKWLSLNIWTTHTQNDYKLFVQLVVYSFWSSSQFGRKDFIPIITSCSSAVVFVKCEIARTDVFVGGAVEEDWNGCKVAECYQSDYDELGEEHQEGVFVASLPQGNCVDLRL